MDGPFATLPASISEIMPEQARLRFSFRFLDVKLRRTLIRSSTKI